MIDRLFLSPRVRLIAGLILIAAGIVIVMCGTVYGMHLSDSPYMFFSARDPQHAPVAMLTFWLGNKWCDVFGFTVESLCRFRGLCNILTFGAGCIWLAAVTRRYFMAAFLFFVLCGLGEFCVAHYFNWDVAVYPWFVVNAIIAVQYIRRPSWGGIVLMGVFTAVITVARIPAITCALIDSVVVIYTGCRNRYGWRNIFIRVLTGIGIFAVTVILLAVMMCGSPAAYIQSFVPENFINGHFELSFLYYRLRYFIPVTVMWGGVIVLISGSYVAAVTNIGKVSKAIVFVLSYIICWNCIRLVETGGETVAVYGLGQMLFIAAILVAWRRHESPIGSDNLCLATLVLFACAAVIGSDTLPERLLALPMLPLAIGFIDLRNTAVSRTFKVLMTALALMGVYHQAYIMYSIHKQVNSPYLKSDTFSSIGTQYVLKDDWYFHDWALEMQKVDKELKENGYNVGYVSDGMLFSYMLLDDKGNPEWLREFTILADDPDQKVKFDKYFNENDCILFPAVIDRNSTPFLVFDRFVKEYGYVVVRYSDESLLAIRPDKAEGIERLLKIDGD